MMFTAIERGVVTVKLTPELRRLALAQVAETERGADAENLTRWFQEQETEDGYVLDAHVAEEAHMILLIARAVLWSCDEYLGES